MKPVSNLHLEKKLPDLHDEIIVSEVLLLKNYHLRTESTSKNATGEAEEGKPIKNEKKKTMKTELVLGGTITKGSLQLH